MAKPKPFNLFIYGTLMNPEVFRAVTGLRLKRRKSEADGIDSFHARRAVLHGYKKISPDHTYLYAVPEPQGRIRGYLVGPLPTHRMAALRHYEGRNYSRRTVTVQTGTGSEQAVAFLGNLKQLAHAFGYDFHDRYKQEVLLEEKIEAALLEAERHQLSKTERVARRAVGELHGATIRDLKRRHFEAGGISDYAIRQSLMDEPLPDFSRIVDDPEAEALAPNYLAMVIRQVIFNQFEERIRRDFRYELDRLTCGPEYYEHTISSLAALRSLNGQPDPLEAIVGNGLRDLSFRDSHLVDFVQWSVKAADGLYDQHLAEHHIDYIRRHKGQGYMPMGAELEFSNIGHSVIHDPQGRAIRDARYDGFLYFPDFGLDVLTWKLGGHVDDHHDKASHDPRRGFFEVAMGNLSVKANISKPLTDDPWLLNQLIHEARSFYKIAPHSVHISLQLRKQQRPVQDRLLPMAAMKCLFAIAGDPVRLPSGQVQIRRLISDEIITAEPTPHMLFSQISRRHSGESEESYPPVRTPHAGGRYVQQFKFLRLAPEVNYEPIVLALKGLQISCRPGSFMTAGQYESSARHRRCFEQLLAWGAEPRALGDEETGGFLDAVRKGLCTERRGKAAHSGAYIAWAVDQLQAVLASFNALVAGPGDRARRDSNPLPQESNSSGNR
ncbi:MAG: gamma-glutamylcyclotransferase family protein [Phycisphaerae bacterium]